MCSLPTTVVQEASRHWTVVWQKSVGGSTTGATGSLDGEVIRPVLKYSPKAKTKRANLRDGVVIKESELVGNREVIDLVLEGEEDLHAGGPL